MIIFKLETRLSTVELLKMFGAVQVFESLRIIPLRWRVGRVRDTRGSSRRGSVGVPGVLF
jgi:hypothetical protein